MFDRVEASLYVGEAPLDLVAALHEQGEAAVDADETRGEPAPLIAAEPAD
ncbi:hypothetical protein ACFRAO_32735 [Streptomyces sp. NPDC056656]